MAYLEIERMNVCYGDTQVLWDVSLHAEKGEVVAIVGSNGMGKTTIVRTVSGLIPLKSGKVRLDGVDIGNKSCSFILTAGISHAPEGRQIFRDMTVHENLEMGAFGEKAKERFDETIKQVHAWFPKLDERRNQSAGTLSGGEQQMLAISRAYMSLPRVMMLDEPSLGLAPNIVDQILHVVRELAERGMTVILVEQDVRKALKVSHRAYVVENGVIRMEGLAADLMSNDEVKKAYLGF